MADRLARLRNLLNRYCPEKAPYISDELILWRDLEIERFAVHSEACRKCGGIWNCTEAYRMPMLRCLPEDVENGFYEDLYYVIGDLCKMRSANLEMRKIGDHRLPTTFKGMSFRTFKSNGLLRDALTAAKLVASGEWEKGLYLFGGTGTGKTHLAVSILQSRIKNKLPGIYITIADLMRRLKMFEQGKTDELLETVKKTQFLLLDDLGTERGSAYELALLFEILNYRMVEQRTAGNPKGLITVITSNYSLNDLADKLTITEDREAGNRIVSRIVGMCEIRQTKGEDYRVLGEKALGLWREERE